MGSIISKRLGPSINIPSLRDFGLEPMFNRRGFKVSMSVFWATRVLHCVCCNSFVKFIWRRSHSQRVYVMLNFVDLVGREALNLLNQSVRRNTHIEFLSR